MIQGSWSHIALAFHDRMIADGTFHTEPSIDSYLDLMDARDFEEEVTGPFEVSDPD